eukprot:scaffold48295_cov77-Phaeocystis_antarctica.AAC.4
MASGKKTHCNHAFRLLCGGRPDRLGSAASPHSVPPWPPSGCLSTLPARVGGAAAAAPPRRAVLDPGRRPRATFELLRTPGRHEMRWP